MVRADISTARHHDDRGQFLLAADREEYLRIECHRRSCFPLNRGRPLGGRATFERDDRSFDRSEEHTSELQSLMGISYAVFCLNKKKRTNILRSIHEQENHK